MNQQAAVAQGRTDRETDSDKRQRNDDEKIQMMTGTAAATLPTSSSPCMIFLIRAYSNNIQQQLHVI